MKLLTRNTLILLSVTLVVFTAGAFIFYYQLQYLIDEEATEELFYKKTQIKKYVSENKNFPEATLLDGIYNFRETNKKIRENIWDTMIYIAEEEEFLPFKQVNFNIPLEGRNYACTIRVALFEADDLIEAIFQSFLIITGLLLCVFVASNYFFSKSIWQPFFKTLDEINAYQTEKHEALSLEGSNVAEFRQLNEAVNRMTEKIAKNFNNLRSFTEYASHELQTPLAIIKNKTDMLLQNPNLNDDQATGLIAIDQTVNRLSKITRTLLLISKIENNQFISEVNADFKMLISKKLHLFEDLIAMKHLSVSTSMQDVTVKMNDVLAEIVISNLISNAIRHTPSEGRLILELDASGFRISNSGNPLRSGGNEIFQRFYKESPETEATGLGLALVKQVADIHKHGIIYAHINGMHSFHYTF